LQCLRIGYDAIVGGGAVVTRDVEPMTTVVGVPARPVHAAMDPDELMALMLPSSLQHR
jgi:acetyltransferase-like isoleucine patch superfamily enzyme